MDQASDPFEHSVEYDLLHSEAGAYLLARYRLENEIHHGINSKLFLLTDLSSGDKHVLKAVHRRPSDGDLAILTRLQHPNLVQVFEVRMGERYTYFVKEFIVGINAKAAIQEHGSFSYREGLRIAMALCNVLHYLHSHKPHPIIYRDLKPENILICDGGSIKLIDLDSIRQYKAESEGDTLFIGTEGYAAPEQFGFSQTDSRTDVYTFGATLYTLLTGCSPAKLRTNKGLPAQETPELSRGVLRIITRCMRFSPEDRYHQIADVQKDLMLLDKPRAIALLLGLPRRTAVLYGLAAVLAILIFATYSSSHGYRIPEGVRAALEDEMPDFIQVPSPAAEIPLPSPTEPLPTPAPSHPPTPPPRRYIVHNPDPDFTVKTDQTYLIITYPEDSITQEYSFDGMHWQLYTEPLTITQSVYVYTRARLPDDSYVTGGIDLTNTGTPPPRRYIIQIADPVNTVKTDRTHLEIIYPEDSVTQEFSFNNVDWYPYIGPMIIDEPVYVYNRARLPDDSYVTGGINLTNTGQKE